MNQDQDTLDILSGFAEGENPTPTRFGVKVTKAVFDLDDQLAVLKLKRVRRQAIKADSAIIMMDVNLAKMLLDTKKHDMLMNLAKIVVTEADKAGYAPSV